MNTKVEQTGVFGFWCFIIYLLFTKLSIQYLNGNNFSSNLGYRIGSFGLDLSSQGFVTVGNKIRSKKLKANALSLSPPVCPPRN